MATKKRTKEAFSLYSTADYLKSEREMAAYLKACLNEAGNDAAFITQALGNIARARGMAQLVKDASLSREQK